MGTESPRWGRGQIVQRHRSGYYYHVVNRYVESDAQTILYRLAGPTHTQYEYIREADAVIEYSSAGFRLPVGVKPATAFGRRVEGILYGYNQRPHTPTDRDVAETNSGPEESVDE